MFVFILLLTFFLNYSPILASDRNIFGLHLTQTQDIISAAPLINSGNGDWGWVTIVIRTDQLDFNTWQNFFNNCRKFHIIPIIRLATIMENNYWKQPSLSDIDNLSNFLNSLNWPSKIKHVILFNEVNHASEWGGIIDIKNYTDISLYAINKLKSLDQNFFILGSAPDLAAPEDPPNFKSAPNFYKEIYQYKPEYFDNIDGLASHSYPNHGYIGTPKDTGQHSIKGYQWELNFLNSLGINRTYPVIITETGWPHREGQSTANEFYTTKTTSKFLIDALSIWSDDAQIKAVTPFIYNYPNPPFDHFSWLNSDEKLYPDYQSIISLPKNKNSPEQINRYEIVSNHLPFILFTNRDYIGHLTLKNTGQPIWGETKFCLNPQSTQNVNLETICTDNNFVYPGQQTTFIYKLKINPSDDDNQKTYISWDNLPPLEITPVYGSGRIYIPKTSFKEKIIQYFQSLFI